MDDLGNVMPAPGNGRPKRARIDKEGNFVAGGTVYAYDTSSVPPMRYDLGSSVFANKGLVANVADFGPMTTSAEIDATIASAVAWLNTSDYRTLCFPPGSYLITSTIPTITGNYKTICGTTTELRRANNGNFFVFGNATPAVFITIYGLKFNATGVPSSAADKVFQFDNAQDVLAYNLTGFTFGIASFGSVSGPAARVNFTMDCRLRNGEVNEYYLLRNCQNSSINGVSQDGSHTSFLADAAMIRIKALPGTVNDTITSGRGLQMQVFGAGSLGIPYGCVIDNTDGSNTNIWFDHNTYFDQFSVAGLYMVDDALSTDTSRNVVFNCRLTARSGNNVLLDKQSSSSIIWAGFYITGFLSNGGTSECVVIQGSGWKSCRLEGAQLVTSNAAVKARAALINSDGWTVCDNTIGQSIVSAANWTTGIEITNIAIVELSIHDNTFATSITTPIALPVFTTIDELAPRRLIESSGQRKAKQLACYPSNFVSNLGGGTTLTKSETYVLLNITSGGTIIQFLGVAPVGTLKIVENVGAAAVTIQHSSGRIRNITGREIILNLYESASFINVNGGNVWQQIGGKIGAQPAITNDSSGAANESKVNEILTALRNAGIILP